MLRVVLDTSSLVSYVLTKGELMRRVVAHWQTGDITLLSSPATRAELARVLDRPAIRRMATASLADLVKGIEQFTEYVPGQLSLPGVCRDPKDEKFIVAAVEGRAHYLISSDRDLLDLRYYQSIAMVKPGQFLLAFELHQLTAVGLTQRFDRQRLAEIQSHIPLEPATATQIGLALATLSTSTDQ